MHTQETIILSDMGKCEPAESLSREVKQGSWRLLEYETVDGLKGVMAYGVPADNPGEIVLPLNASGRYRIFLGTNYNKNPYSDSAIWEPSKATNSEHLRSTNKIMRRDV